MYYLVSTKEAKNIPYCNYEFTSFDSFYELTKVITVMLTGKYNIKIEVKKITDDIFKFINSSDNYDAFNIYIVINEQMMKYVLLRKPNANRYDKETEYQVWLRLISEYHIWFDHNVGNKLYFSIQHDYTTMDGTLRVISEKFKPGYKVTLNDISKLFVIDNLVYPTRVMTAFVKMYAYRWSVFSKCYKNFGNDIMFYSIRNALDRFMAEKLAYYKTGIGRDFIKTIPMQNLTLMYYAFHSTKLTSVRAILSMYERGETINDLENE